LLEEANVLMENRAEIVKPASRNQAIWAIIAAIAGIDALWAWSASITIAPDLKTPLGLAVLILINSIYLTARPNPRIAALAGSSAQLVAFTAVANVLSYLTVASNFPLIDRYLSTADAAIGFDWLALFSWIQDHPEINRVLGFAYASSIAQIVVLLILLSVLGMLERMAEFVWLFVLTLLFIVPISWIMPAEGAWAYYGVAHLTSAYYLPDFFALREGAMREIVLAKLIGVIQFPSFHTALGLILIYVTRGIRLLFPASLGLNALMIASTLTAGGHYLVDIIGGAAIVPLAIIIFGWGQREPAKLRLAGGMLSAARD
jgi:membrane-associated phospholipid phosphatase